MAWFKKNQDAAPAPYTLERLTTALDRLEWKSGEPDEGDQYRIAYFDGYFTVFSAEFSENFLLVSCFSTGAILPEERFPEAVNWSNEWNLNTVYGTARPILDEDKDVVLRVDTAFPVSEGVTDEQLDLFLQVAVSCNSQALDKYVEDFQIQRELPSED